MEIGLISKGSKLSDRDLAFIAAAVDIQMRDHFCPAWGLDPWPVVAYTNVPKGPVHPIWFADNLGDNGYLGYHTDVGGNIFGRALVQGFEASAITASHEALEMRMDPECTLWWPGDRQGELIAAEVCDAVEDTWYTIDVTIGTETRKVPVSNFVLPAWAFGESDRQDFLGRLPAYPKRSLTPGGYYIRQNPDGTTENVYGTHVRPYGIEAKTTDAVTRTGRRHGARLTLGAQPHAWMP